MVYPPFIWYVTSATAIYSIVGGVKVADRTGVFVELKGMAMWSALNGLVALTLIPLIDFGVLDYRVWDTVVSFVWLSLHGGTFVLG